MQHKLLVIALCRLMLRSSPLSSVGGWSAGMMSSDNGTLLLRPTDCFTLESDNLKGLLSLLVGVACGVLLSCCPALTGLKEMGVAGEHTPGAALSTSGTFTSESPPQSTRLLCSWSCTDTMQQVDMVLRHIEVFFVSDSTIERFLCPLKRKCQVNGSICWYISRGQIPVRPARLSAKLKRTSSPLFNPLTNYNNLSARLYGMPMLNCRHSSNFNIPVA